MNERGRSSDKKTIDVASEAARARAELTGDSLPFWLEHGMDGEYGGLLTGLDRRGRCIERDKSMWFQGRFAWVCARSYSDIDADPRYLEAARSCLHFLDRHGRTDSGRYYYRVTRDGAPLRMRRYLFTECFAAAAHAAFAEATGEMYHLESATSILETVRRCRDTPGALEPKEVPGTRPARGFALPMILLNVAQTLRRAARALDDAAAGALADRTAGESVDLITRYFINDEHRCVLEQCGPDGEILDHFEGRTLNPGHAIEGAWFILEEAVARGRSGGGGEVGVDRGAGGRHSGGRPTGVRIAGSDPELTELGVRMLDYMWEWGWDREYGGLYYFRDVLGHPSPEYWHDMKFWWPHTEAIIATHFAFSLTGEERFAERYHAVSEWSYEHFPDREHGEWFGYLRRDGSVSSDIKGSMFKGPFHIPRMLLLLSTAR